MNTQTTPFPRHQGLGGSDVAAALGLSPFKTQAALWAEKRRLPSAENTSDALHLRLGHHLEPFIANEVERQTGLQAHRFDQTFFHPEHPMFFAHIDRFLTKPGHPLLDAAGQLRSDTLLECKSAHAFASNQWGEPGSDQMPAAYLLQVVWYLALTGCEQAVVAVLLGNQRVDRYEVQRDRALEAIVLTQARKFWDEHVVAGIAPRARVLSDLRLLYPDDDPCASLEANDALRETLNRYQSLQASIGAAQAQADALKLEIQQAMGKACTLIHQGKVLATWKQPKPTQRVDLTALQADHPALVASYMRRTPNTRRFVVKLTQPFEDALADQGA